MSVPRAAACPRPAPTSPRVATGGLRTPAWLIRCKAGAVHSLSGQGLPSVGAGSPDPAPALTAGLLRLAEGETCGRGGGTVGRPCPNTGGEDQIRIISLSNWNARARNRK